MRLVMAVFLFLLIAGPVYAQDPTPAPGGGGIDVEQDDLPYHFEPITYTTTGGPISTHLDVFFGADFINRIGSVALTLFTIVDAKNVLGIFVVFLLAVWLLWRIYKFTTTSTPDGTANLNVYDDPDGGPEESDEYILERRYSSNPYRVYTQTLRKK